MEKTPHKEKCARMCELRSEKMEMFIILAIAVGLYLAALFIAIDLIVSDDKDIL